MLEKINESVDFIRSKCGVIPKTAIILGSGLGGLADIIEEKTVIPYREIPHFFASTAVGHAGELVLGRLGGVEAVAMKGRIHYYEGKSMEEVVFPVRVMRFLGAEALIVTNAAGGMNESFSPGDLMLISDHINLSGQNPLIGENDERIGTRFPGMSYVYDPELRDKARRAAWDLGFSLKEGVYLYTTGPSYETPAEIRMMRTVGADAVGMSTVPEVIAAVHAGMKVLGISCISNMAAGIGPDELDHCEVLDTANRIKDRFSQLTFRIVTNMYGENKSENK